MSHNTLDHSEDRIPELKDNVEELNCSNYLESLKKTHDPHILEQYGTMKRSNIKILSLHEGKEILI